jgi:hypothetical protein
MESQRQFKTSPELREYWRLRKQKQRANVKGKQESGSTANKQLKDEFLAY